MKRAGKIFSIPLAIILIASTLGFSVNRHYCMGMMVEESFYAPADICSKNTDSHCNSFSEEIGKDCCSEENLNIAGINIISPAKKKTDLPGKLFSPLAPHQDVLLQGFPHFSVRTSYDIYLRPLPLKGREILILVQRFLI